MLIRLITGTLRGAAAGAAGTTALNAATYLDMVARGRPTSSTPEQTVEAISEATGVSVPGEGEERDSRLSGLGALSGIAAGVGTGAMLGAARALGLRPGLLVSSVLATTGALAGSNGPMFLLGVSDPRTWDSTAWLSDIVPHLAYGVTAAATVIAMDTD